jgi:vancomycin permeability regulator SanA
MRDTLVTKWPIWGITQDLPTRTVGVHLGTGTFISTSEGEWTLSRMSEDDAEIETHYLI